MKTRNLLLAGFVAVAMSACSNSEDILDNKIQEPTGEEAAMRVSFTVSANGTRGVTDGGTEAGSLDESEITTATIVLDYGGSKRLIKNNLMLNKENPINKDYIATTVAFTVTKGTNVNIYAFINPSDALNAQIASKENIDSLTAGVHVLPATGLNYLADGIAKNKNFLMVGVTKGVDIKDLADKANTAIVEVNRISAKLDEGTKADTHFELQKPTVKPVNDKEIIDVKIIKHSYSNLPNDSYIMGIEDTYIAGFLQPFGAFDSEKENEHIPYRWIETGVTYCLENHQNEQDAWVKTAMTNVHYKAQVYFQGDQGNPAKTFYVKKFINTAGKTESIIYKSWNDLKKKYTNLVDESAADEAYLKANEITKYADGLCYYVAPINHSSKGMTIIRNNWYQLEVTKVNDLGWPTEVMPEEDKDARLVVTANIKPWTIHKNNIEL